MALYAIQCHERNIGHTVYGLYYADVPLRNYSLTLEYCLVIISTKDVMSLSLLLCPSVCLFVSNFAQQLPNGCA